MSKPFFSTDGRRLNFEEIVALCRQRYGLDLVGGLSKVCQTKGVHHLSGRPASFQLVREVWTLHQQEGQHLSWMTERVPDRRAPRIGFLFAMGMGMGSPVPQPSGAFQIVLCSSDGNELCRFLLPVVKSPQWRRDGEAVLAYVPRRVETASQGLSLCLDDELTQESLASFGIALIVLEAQKVPIGKSLQVTVTPRGVPSRRWFRLEQGKRYADWNIPAVLEFLDPKPGLPAAEGGRIYFGDIHVHSGEAPSGRHGCGCGTIKDNYLYARDAARLDFFCLTDHDYDICEQRFWEMYKQAAAHYDQPGRFAALLGFEWTGVMYGHRNIYYRGLEGPMLNACPSGAGGRWNKANPTPAQLYAGLRKAKLPVLTIPHHPPYGYHPFNWETLDVQMDRLVEIYSTWGSSEYGGSPYANIGSDTYEDLFVDRALISGHRFGLVAGSDGHDGCPGFANWPGLETRNVHPHLIHSLGSGRTAVFSDDLNREAIFDALYARRCYATTGEAIVLRFAIEDHTMGQEIAVQDLPERPKLQISARGTTALTKLQIVKNGRLLTSVDVRQVQEELEIIDDRFDPRRPNFYYAKVTQRDGEMAWSSPIFIFS